MASSVFLDSNVIFSAVLSRTCPPRRILWLAASGAIRVVISQQVEREVRRNLEKKVPEVAHLLPTLLQEANVAIVPDPSSETVCELLPYVRYAPDAMVLAAAKQADVDYFVTGDARHLLSAAGIRDHVPFRMLSPSEFLRGLQLPLSP